MAVNADLCCGCGLCSQVCPKHAISMHPDAAGFLVPTVDAALCVECGLCEKLCVSRQHPCPDRPAPDRILAYRGPDSLRIKSTSGGAFLALSDEILKHGGVIYGAAYDKDFTLKHMRATDPAVRDTFCGSKYAQSDMTGIFASVAADLQRLQAANTDGLVLFTGTPCQTAAMHNYARRNTDKAAQDRLVLMDFICSGTPSGKLFREYVAFAGKKRNKTVVSYSGRSKDTPWQQSRSKLCYSDGSAEIGTPLAQAYQNIYGLNLADCDICYQCPYVSGFHCSDITVGDFWGVDKVMPEFNDKKGISLVFLNTHKGSALFRQATEGLGESRPLTLEQAKQRNHFAQHAVPEEARREFRKTYVQKGITAVLRAYGQLNFLGSIKTVIKKFVNPKADSLAVRAYKKLRTTYTQLLSK